MVHPMIPRLSLLIVLVLLMIPAYGSGKERGGREHFSESVIVAAGTVIEGDYVAAGRTIQISGTVNGDVYAAGRDVLVDGVINGDLLTTGVMITVSGAVSENLRAAGGHVVISGTVGRNSTIAGGHVEITPSAILQGELVAVAGDMGVEGRIARNARIAAGDATVSARIGGTLTVAARSVRLASNTMVEKHFRYWSVADASIDEQATVLGRVIREQVPESLTAWNGGRLLAALWFSLALINFTSTLVLGLLLIHMSPANTERIGSTIAQRPAASFVWGAAVCVLTPILAALLMMTVIGIPLGGLLLALYLMSLYVVRIYVMACAGQRLVAWSGRPIHPSWAFVSGLVLYTVLGLIPIVGTFISLSAVLFGMGATVLAKQEQYRTLRKQSLV
jgi:cytoskeletal protein CcmA (bactofilin family)